MFTVHKCFIDRKEQQQIQVKSPGGTRTVSFTVDESGDFTDAWLCGEAKEVFTGQVIIM